MTDNDREDRFNWTGENQIEMLEVSPLWLDTVKPGDAPHGGLPPLGDATCDESEEEHGYWCSLPKGHRDSKHVAQGEKAVVAVWST